MSDNIYKASLSDFHNFPNNMDIEIEETKINEKNFSPKYEKDNYIPQNNFNHEIYSNQPQTKTEINKELNFVDHNNLNLNDKDVSTKIELLQLENYQLKNQLDIQKYQNNIWK